jgi:hypothetical protein
MMGIDMGVGNLIAVSFNSKKDPVLVNGRLLKSMAGFIHCTKRNRDAVSDISVYC